MKQRLFFENELPGSKEDYKIGYNIKKRIASFKSKYQKIEVLELETFGRVLILDGIIQLSERYEFIYHEMLSHLALGYHKDPKKVLIVGGGDGGVLREVLKHSIQEVFLVEIDKKVIEVCKKYFPFLKLKHSLKDKRVNLVIENGAKFVKQKKNFFDIIINDSTDNAGESKILFSKKFYKDVFNSLKDKGIFITQSGNFVEQFPEIRANYQKLKDIFGFVKMHKAPVFDYGLALYAFNLGAKNNNLDNFSLKEAEENFKKIEGWHLLKYYSPQIHICSGSLPKFWQQKL